MAEKLRELRQARELTNQLEQQLHTSKVRVN